KFSALIPVDDNLVVSQGVDIDPSQIFRGTSTVGLGTYVDLGIDATSRLKLIPTLRLDTYLLEGRQRGSVDPRFVFRYQADKQWTIKGYVGEFSQPPQPEALDGRFGNPDVGIEHSTQFGLGWEWRPDRVWKFDSEFYYTRRRDVV